MPRICDPGDLHYGPEITITWDKDGDYEHGFCDLGLYCHYELGEENPDRSWRDWPIEKKRVVWDKICGYE